jgi:hypothetical protein
MKYHIAAAISEATTPAAMISEVDSPLPLETPPDVSTGNTVDGGSDVPVDCP